MHSNLWSMYLALPHALLRWSRSKELFSWSNELEEQLLRELNEWPQATDLIFGHAKDVPSSSQGKSKHEWYAELEYELFNEDLHLSWVWRQDPSIPDRHRKLEQSKMRGKISNQYIPRSRPIIPFGSSISNIFKTRKTWQKQIMQKQVSFSLESEQAISFITIPVPNPTHNSPAYHTLRVPWDAGAGGSFIDSSLTFYFYTSFTEKRWPSCPRMKKSIGGGRLDWLAGGDGWRIEGNKGQRCVGGD